MNKKFIPFIIIAVAVIAAFLIAKPDFLAFFPGGGEFSQREPALSLRQPAPVPLPDGPQDYIISSDSKIYPRFASARIDPLKVSVGDTQFMRIVVQDDADITSVVAEIETDNDTVKVPLMLNSGAPKFTFEGSWVVRDTHVRTYRTKFIAKDIQGRENSITMAWSDPCAGGLDGPTGSETRALTANCTIGTYVVDGIDNANLALNGKTLTINASGTFVWNPGKTITIGTGTIAINSVNARIKQSYLWVQECGDPPDQYSNANIVISSSSSVAPDASYVRRYTTVVFPSCNSYGGPPQNCIQIPCVEGNCPVEC